MKVTQLTQAGCWHYRFTQRWVEAKPEHPKMQQRFLNLNAKE